MILRIVTETTGDPVSVLELRDHLRVQSTEDDYLLRSYIRAATKLAENKTKRALMPQTWKVILDDFIDTMELPRPPLSTSSALVAITYLDATGGSTTLGSSVYQIDSESEPGRILLGYDQAWPEVYEQANSVTIQYTCGYPLSTNSTVTVPEPIRLWIMVRAGQMYEYRTPLVDGNVPRELPRDYIDGLLDSYVVMTI